MIVLYKRYNTETVERIAALANENDYPCELSTVKRLKIWFFLLREYFENTLISLAFLYDYDNEICEEINLLISCFHRNLYPDRIVREYHKKIPKWLQRKRL